MADINEGSVVFAISDGYPNWPSLVRGTRTSKGAKQFKVRYLGNKEFDSDWLDLDEVFPWTSNKAKMGNPTFTASADGTSANEVKAMFKAAMEKAEAALNKPEEPAGRRGRASDIGLVASAVASPATAPKAGANKRKSGLEVAPSPKRQKSATSAAAETPAAPADGPAAPSPKKGGRAKTAQTKGKSPAPAAPAPAPAPIVETETIVTPPGPTTPRKGGRQATPKAASPPPASPKPAPARSPSPAKPKGRAKSLIPATQTDESDPIVGPSAHAASGGEQAVEIVKLKKQNEVLKKGLGEAVKVLQKVLESV